VSVGKGIEAKSQNRNGSPGGAQGGDKRRASGGGTSKRSLASYLERMDRTIGIKGIHILKGEQRQCLFQVNKFQVGYCSCVHLSSFVVI
jgi:hypothetical protein